MELTVHQGNRIHRYTIQKGERLLELLTANGYEVNAVCGGNGSCFKCRVRILSPYIEPTRKELTALSTQELASGIRLACDILLTEDTEVELMTNEKMEVLLSSRVVSSTDSSTEKVKAVIDIGTTTVVIALVGGDGGVIDSIGEKNRQASFGADVIARVKYVASGGLKELNAIILTQIREMLSALTEKNAVARLDSVTVCGNTAMLHLFFGRDCAGLGYHPYQPEFLAAQTVSASELGLGFDTEVRSLPCIAGFAGADLTAGILSELGEDSAYTLLLDLGTNAEIALFNTQRIYASSAAAGPAFEGASIKQGMAAVRGAVCSFELINGIKRVKTIGNAMPTGICGSGLIDVVAELLKNKIVDETGLMVLGKEFEICDDVYIYAEDIREVQLAKAAIAAAIDMILIAAEVGTAQVGRVLISGGFGSYINVDNAAFIGLFPPELREKTAAVGNSSLAGGILCASSGEKSRIADAIAEKTVYLNLADSAEFVTRYVDHMMF